MKENVFKLVFATVIAGVTAYMKILAVPLIVLIAVMIIDYASGMMKAWITATLSSRIGIKGILKKVGYLLIVAVSAVVDWLIHSALGQFGIHIDVGMYIGLVVTVWLIINELISILENLAIIGIPLPKMLTKLVKKLKVAVENTATINENEED